MSLAHEALLVHTLRRVVPRLPSMDAQDETRHAERPSQEDIAGGGGLPVAGVGAVVRTLQELSQKPVAQQWRRGPRRRTTLVILVIPTCTPLTLCPI